MDASAAMRLRLVVLQELRDGPISMFRTRVKKVANRTAVITGAGGGLGRALALQLAGRQCNVVLLDINEAALQETASLARQRNVRVSMHVVDITDAEQVGLALGSAHDMGVPHLLAQRSRNLTHLTSWD